MSSYLDLLPVEIWIFLAWGLMTGLVVLEYVIFESSQLLLMNWLFVLVVLPLLLMNTGRPLWIRVVTTILETGLAATLLVILANKLLRPKKRINLLGGPKL